MDHFEVVDYPWPVDQPLHKGHNRAEVPKGTIVYAIKYKPFGVYFYYAYTSRSYAKHVANKFDADIPSIEANFRVTPGVVTARTED
jgi:hypothetical protein